KYDIFSSFFHDYFFQWRFAFVFVDNKTYTGIESNITDHPVDKCNDAIAEADKRHQMDQHPDPPGKKTLKTNFSDVHHCLVTSYGSHRTFIEIVEFFSRLIIQHAYYIFGHEPALLLRYRRHSRMSPRRVLSNDCCYVTDSKNVC